MGGACSALLLKVVTLQRNKIQRQRNQTVEASSQRE